MINLRHPPLKPLIALLAAVLGVSPSFAAEPVQKLSLAIPPGRAELDALQDSYEKSSRELEAALVSVQKNAKNCALGQPVAEGLENAPAKQKAQRERILNALNQSKLDLQTELAKLDDAGALGEAGAGTLLVATSKDIISAGAAKPSAAIHKELAHIDAYNAKMEKSLAGAKWALAGEGERCRQARETYFEIMRPAARAIPVKLRQIAEALREHERTVRAYADTVENSLVKNSGALNRAPAAAQ